MAARAEVLVCGCRDDDVAVIREALGPDGPVLRSVSSPVKAAHHAVADRPLAFALGIGKNTLSHLDLIPVIRAVRSDLPVIVIAQDDSLELERAARRKGIFYYLVRPLEDGEVRAVFRDALRAAPHGKESKP